MGCLWNKQVGTCITYNSSKCERTAYGNELDALVLCADKSDTLVEYTLPEDNKQFFAAIYLPYLPTKEELRRELKLEEFKKKE